MTSCFLLLLFVRGKYVFLWKMIGTRVVNLLEMTTLMEDMEVFRGRRFLADPAGFCSRRRRFVANKCDFAFANLFGGAAVIRFTSHSAMAAMFDGSTQQFSRMAFLHTVILDQLERGLLKKDSFIFYHFFAES